MTRPVRKPDLDALRTLIHRRRVGPFIDLDAGEIATRALLARKRRASRRQVRRYRADTEETDDG